MDLKLASTISELAAAGPFGRSKLFDEIRKGNLPAKKAGNRTIVLTEDFEKFLRALPPATPGAPPKPSSHP